MNYEFGLTFQVSRWNVEWFPGRIEEKSYVVMNYEL